MPSKQYHILNGDVLYDRLTERYEDLTVMRECMIVGQTNGETLEEIFSNRKSFFEKNYDVSYDGYTKKVVKEIENICNFTGGSTVNLWFENDLFCQTNFWFSIFILHYIKKDFDLYLVSPNVDSWQGFGAMSDEDLESAFQLKKRITPEDQIEITQLWKAFQNSNWKKLKNHASSLSVEIANLENVIQAHIERFPDDKSMGRPQKSLMKIVSECEHASFGTVFRKFSEMEGIYGFGDLQVKHIMEQMNLSVIS